MEEYLLAHPSLLGFVEAHEKRLAKSENRPPTRSAFRAYWEGFVQGFAEAYEREYGE